MEDCYYFYPLLQQLPWCVKSQTRQWNDGLVTVSGYCTGLVQVAPCLQPHQTWMATLNKRACLKTHHKPSWKHNDMVMLSLRIKMVLSNVWPPRFDFHFILLLYPNQFQRFTENGPLSLWLSVSQAASDCTPYLIEKVTLCLTSSFKTDKGIVTYWKKVFARTVNRTRDPGLKGPCIVSINSLLHPRLDLTACVKHIFVLLLRKSNSPHTVGEPTSCPAGLKEYEISVLSHMDCSTYPVTYSC